MAAMTASTTYMAGRAEKEYADKNAPSGYRFYRWGGENIVGPGRAAQRPYYVEIGRTITQLLNFDQLLKGGFRFRVDEKNIPFAEYDDGTRTKLYPQWADPYFAAEQVVDEPVVQVTLEPVIDEVVAPVPIPVPPQVLQTPQPVLETQKITFGPEPVPEEVYMTMVNDEPAAVPSLSVTTPEIYIETAPAKKPVNLGMVAAGAAALYFLFRKK